MVAINQETINDMRKLLAHRLIARHIVAMPALLEEARRTNAAERREQGETYHNDAWARILTLSPLQVARLLRSSDENMVALRTASPFRTVPGGMGQDIDWRRKLHRKAVRLVGELTELRPRHGHMALSELLDQHHYPVFVRWPSIDRSLGVNEFDFKNVCPTLDLKRPIIVFTRLVLIQFSTLWDELRLHCEGDEISIAFPVTSPLQTIAIRNDGWIVLCRRSDNHQIMITAAEDIMKSLCL